MPIQVGVAQNPIPPMELLIARAQAAEAEGFDSLWYPDHLMGWFPKALWRPESSSIVHALPSPHVYFDPAVVIALAGSATERVTIGTAVTDSLRRPPAELARTFITLSHATGGRAILGIGAGERENTSPYGIDYRYQASRLEEALHVIRLLWESREPVDHTGRFWSLRRAVLDLEPYDGRFPPIWLGAHGPRMLKMTGMYADGWLPSLPMTPNDYAERLRVVREAARDCGRDPEAIMPGYMTYVVGADDHETAHRILASPLAGAMALAGSSWQWERSGRPHPLGQGFEGLRDYVPEWYSPEQLQVAVSAYDPEVFHDLIPHGTGQEIADSLAGFIDVGMRHLVCVNLSPLGGLEYIDPSRQATGEARRVLTSSSGRV